MVFRMSREKNFGNTICIAFGFLKHRELIRVDGLIFVNAGLNVPAGEVTTECPRKSSSAKSADWRPLPEAVINVAAVQCGLLCARAFERLSDGTLPGDFGNFGIGANRRKEKRNSEKQSEQPS